jgi:hypothetical protein
MPPKKKPAKLRSDYKDKEPEKNDRPLDELTDVDDSFSVYAPQGYGPPTHQGLATVRSEFANSWLELRDSTLPGARKGVFATRLIKKGEDLGHYDGELLTEKMLTQRYGKRTGPYVVDCGDALEDRGTVVNHPGVGTRMFIDAANPNKSNLLRYINDADYDGKTNTWMDTGRQNVITKLREVAGFDYCDLAMVRTTRDILFVPR